MTLRATARSSRPTTTAPARTSTGSVSTAVPGQSSSDEQARDAGCLAVVFGAQGARGNFVTAGGVSCVIVSATATAAIDLPPAAPDVGQPGVASGKFTLECAGGDKTRLKFEGVFALPVVARFLTC